MKKLTILALVLLFTLLLTSVAFAEGWHKIGTTDNPTNKHTPEGDTPAGDTYWANESGGDASKVPHRGLQSSSNNCKTCHAVHDAIGESFKLLRDSSRVTECNFCHVSATGLTDPDKKPYTVSDPYGEHTLGAMSIPESNVTTTSVEEDGLSCGNCHSVHNAYTLDANPPLAGSLGTKLLRRDPGNNGGDALAGVTNVATYQAGKPPAIGPTGAINENEVLTSFCGDCHNKNVNWDRGLAGTEGERPNGFAHPLGNGIDGIIDVYGQLKSVSSVGRTYTCSSCHVSRGEVGSRFPHQSRGHKLFGEAYRDESPVAGFNYTGDPYRPIPNTDAKVCRGCHSEIGKPDSSDSF